MTRKIEARKLSETETVRCPRGTTYRTRVIIYNHDGTTTIVNPKLPWRAYTYNRKQRVFYAIRTFPS